MRYGIYYRVLSCRHSKSLDKKAETIIEENKYFEDLYHFFKSEYKNSQSLLDDIKR